MNKLRGVITHISEVFDLGQYKKIYIRVQEEQGDYPQSSYFEIFGEQKVDNVLKFNQVGDVVEVDFNLKTNESKKEAGVFFNGIQAWKITKV